MPPIITWEHLTEQNHNVSLRLGIQPPYNNFWEHGFLIVRADELPGIFPLIDRYVAVRGPHGEYAGPCAYLDCEEMRDLCLFPPLLKIMESIFGEQVGLHLTLNGWRSTERNWHQDTVLNPPHVGQFYCAVWIALDEIDQNAGPFQYIDGSHTWGEMTMAKTLGFLPDGARNWVDWPKKAERFQVPAAEYKIEQMGYPVSTFWPAHKGDVLFWHSQLLHRGSTPNDPSLERRALIAHYSGVNHRQDMPVRVTVEGGVYFVP